jgi:hypothetical protein
MAKAKEKVPTSADQLRVLTEQAQRQPGLSQLLSLLEQTQDAERAIRDMTPDAGLFLGGTLGHTY